MAWKKLLTEDDFGGVSDATPQAVDGTAAAAGTDPTASRDDHVHALGPLVADLDFALKEANGMALENAASGPDSGSEVPGQLFYDTANDRAYLWVV